MGRDIIFNISPYYHKRFEMNCILKIVVVIGIIFSNVPYAFCGAQLMSDSELDSVCAGGLDINVDAVLSLRQSAAISQCNVAATSGFSNAGTNISNMNSATIISTIGSVSVNQKNMAYVVATEGDVTSASIDNLNYAYVNSVDPNPEITQENVAMLIAMNGSVRDCTISNVNIVEFPGQVSNAILKRDNISVIVAQNSSNNSIITSNQIIYGNNPVTTQPNAFTYSHNGLTATVTVN